MPETTIKEAFHAWVERMKDKEERYEALLQIMVAVRLYVAVIAAALFLYFYDEIGAALADFTAWLDSLGAFFQRVSAHFAE
jgi:hypothetical protein